MNYILKLGAALVALLASLPALAIEGFISVMAPPVRRRGRLSSEAGVAILYTSPGIGTASATPPTAAQAHQLPTQTAQVTFADGDAQAVIVTNWGLPASFPSYGFPEIAAYWLSQTASPSSFQTALTFGISNTNSVTVNKTNVGTGSGGVLQVILRRPHSAGL